MGFLSFCRLHFSIRVSTFSQFSGGTSPLCLISLSFFSLDVDVCARLCIWKTQTRTHHLKNCLSAQKENKVCISPLSQLLHDGVLWVDLHGLLARHVPSRSVIPQGLSLHDSFHVGSPARSDGQTPQPSPLCHPKHPSQPCRVPQTSPSTLPSSLPRLHSHQAWDLPWRLRQASCPQTPCESNWHIIHF